MKSKTVFFCSECGNDEAKWFGKCPSCGAWNTAVEQAKEPSTTGKRTSAVAGPSSVTGIAINPPKHIANIELGDELRFQTGLGELDRVLGGGAVQGSLVLVGGAPGIGKSTLMLQICHELSRFSTVLYVSGEESARQIKMRAQRLNIHQEGLYLQSETKLGNVIEGVHSLKPDILIVDSIQTLYHEQSNSAPGSVTQVKECTMALMHLAKGEGITIFVIGHVNKEGSIAGPKVLEHMVDCVLYFEGEQHMAYRILRAAKNRFGATNEIGVFEMDDKGLTEIPNPSEALLSGRPIDAAGTCVTCVMEGIRPVLAEIQALVVPTSFGNPRRVSNGFDYNRAVLLLAVLEKRGGLLLSNCDAYLNIIGGLSLDEPAADLATVVALASSFRDIPVPSNLAAIGEVGLTGELRAVNSLGQRLSEIARLGFTKCLMPKRTQGNFTAPEGLDVIPVSNIREALAVLMR
ncbi:MAG: DNA repair protein RadA [Eubacteriales bacterium]